MKMAFNQLEKKDYMKTSLRAYFLQNGFNYGNYQGLGYANVLYPALRKMYKDDDDKLQEALKENIEFFNTNIHFLPFITSLHLVMLENKTPSNEIRNIKMALMGPLAGMTVISGLAVNFVKISTPIQYVANMPGDQQKVVAIQEMIDAIAPKLLPVLFTGLIFYLIKVKKWTTYKLVILTIILGVVLSVLHLIA